MINLSIINERQTKVINLSVKKINNERIPVPDGSGKLSERGGFSLSRNQPRTEQLKNSSS